MMSVNRPVRRGCSMCVTLVLALVLAAGARAQPAAPELLVTGLQGASGSAVGPGGALFVTEGAIGRVSRVDPQTGERLQEVTRRGRKDLVLDRMIREVVSELLAAVEPSLADLPLRELPAEQPLFQPVPVGTVSGGASSANPVNGHAPQHLPSADDSSPRPAPPSEGGAAEKGTTSGEGPQDVKHFEIALGCAPFVTTGVASEYFKLGILPSISFSYLFQGQLMRLGLGLYGGVNIFTAVGTVASSDNFIVPMGLNLRYEIGNERYPCVQFGISGGPALFLMNSTANGMLAGLTFYGRGSLGVRLPLGRTFGLTLEAGYDVYWEQPSPIMGFSPSVLTTFRL